MARKREKWRPVSEAAIQISQKTDAIVAQATRLVRASKQLVARSKAHRFKALSRKRMP